MAYKIGTVLLCSKTGSTGKIFALGRVSGTVLVHIVAAKDYHKKGDTQVWRLSETTQC